MATLKNHIAFLVRGVGASVDFEVRLARARGPLPGPPPKRARVGPHKLGQVRARPEESPPRSLPNPPAPTNPSKFDESLLKLGLPWLAASPNPVPAGEELGVTTITWTTGDG